MDNSQPALAELTPLQDRAIRRFEYDRQFYLRVHVEAGKRRLLDENLAMDKSLQDVMLEFQTQDEEKYSDDAIVRGATYLGRDILGIFYNSASVPEQESLKAGVRRIIAAVNEES